MLWTMDQKTICILCGVKQACIALLCVHEEAPKAHKSQCWLELVFVLILTGSLEKRLGRICWLHDLYWKEDWNGNIVIHLIFIIFGKPGPFISRLHGDLMVYTGSTRFGAIFKHLYRPMLSYSNFIIGVCLRTNACQWLKSKSESKASGKICLNTAFTFCHVWYETWCCKVDFI